MVQVDVSFSSDFVSLMCESLICLCSKYQLISNPMSGVWQVCLAAWAEGVWVEEACLEGAAEATLVVRTSHRIQWSVVTHYLPSFFKH